MRPIRQIRRPAAWALLCLLAGCHDSSQLPDSCADNEALLSFGGRFSCQPLPTIAGQPPACGDGEALSVSGGALICAKIAIASTVQQSVKQAIDAAAALQTSIAGLAGRASALFRGVTTFQSAGRIMSDGSDPGIASARARCDGEYPGAHLCTAYELYGTVVAGRLGAADRIPRAWLYFPGWNTPLAGATLPLGGIADHCGGFTYGADDLGWSGSAVEWTTLPTGDTGFKFHGGTDAPCSMSLPLACCGGAK